MTPPRQIIEVDGISHLPCSNPNHPADVPRIQPAAAFYRLPNPASQCKLNSWCKTCCCRQRVQARRRDREAAKVKALADKPSPARARARANVAAFLSQLEVA